MCNRVRLVFSPFHDILVTQLVIVVISPHVIARPDCWGRIIEQKFLLFLRFGPDKSALVRVQVEEDGRESTRGHWHYPVPTSIAAIIPIDVACDIANRQHRHHHCHRSHKHPPEHCHETL